MKNLHLSKYKKGDTVLIFTDPYSGNRDEGVFTLIECYKVTPFKTMQREE